MKNLQKHLQNKNGFTYLMALILIMIMGIMLGAIGQSWQTIMKRERETELLFRGGQIRDAIKAWNEPKKIGVNKPPPLTDLKYLLEDPSSIERTRYLRRLYTDPITGKDWEIIRVNGVITGVYSSSLDKPLKADNFPDELKDLADKQSYSEWKFMYVPAGQPQINPSGVPAPVSPSNRLKGFGG